MRSDACRAAPVRRPRRAQRAGARAAPTARCSELIGRSPAALGRADGHALHAPGRQPRGRRHARCRRKRPAALQSQVKLASGTIRSSLFAASDEARVPDAIAIQMAEIFAADIDMHRELRRGDTFSVVYESMTADGEAIGWGQSTGRVLAAEFVNAGKTHQAVWYRANDGRGAYFDLSGQSKRRAFLASPMEFSRVTSGFAMRFHPIHQTWRKPPRRRLRSAHRHAGAQRRRRRGRVRRPPKRLRQRRRDQAHATIAARCMRTCRASTCARASASSKAVASAQSAPPAGPPARTCTSSSASTARTRIRCASPRPAKR